MCPPGCQGHGVQCLSLSDLWKDQSRLSMEESLLVITYQIWHGNPLLDSCLAYPMNRGAWQAIQSTGLQRVGNKWRNFSMHMQIYITQASSLVLRILHWVAQPQGWRNLPESLSSSPSAGCTLPTGSQCQARSTRVQSPSVKGQFTGQGHLPSWGGGPAGARGSGREREWGASFSSNPWQPEEPSVRLLVAGLIRGCFGWLPLDTGLSLTPHLKLDQTCSEPRWSSPLAPFRLKGQSCVQEYR